MGSWPPQVLSFSLVGNMGAPASGGVEPRICGLLAEVSPGRNCGGPTPGACHYASRARPRDTERERRTSAAQMWHSAALPGESTRELVTVARRMRAAGGSGVAAARRRSGLAGARRAAGHTQESLAAILHIDRSTVIRWEAGEHAPQPYLRPRLARVLGRTPAQLGELIDGDIQPGVVTRELNSASVDVDDALNWIDLHAGWPAGTSRRKLSSRLSASRRWSWHTR